MNDNLISITSLSQDSHKQPKDIGTARKSFIILEEVLKSNLPLSVSKIIANTEISKPSVHRIVNLLCDFGLIEKCNAQNGYQAGRSMLKLSHQALANNISKDIQTLAMERLVNEINETVNYGVFSGSQVTYINRVEAKWPLGLRFEVGSHVPAHCTSIGKLMLALLSQKKLASFIASADLTRYTKNTLITTKDLQKSLAYIQETEIGTDNQEFMDGVVCVAVPVKAVDGKVLGSIAASAPEARMTLKELLVTVPALRRTAEQIANAYL